MSDKPLRDWMGREETATDVVSESVIARLAALLNHERPLRPADTLPPLGHWLHFASTAMQSELGADGHVKRGTFLPPIALPRRMWAGSAIEFLAPIRVGETIRRKSTIADVTEKTGSTGPLVFVKVAHEISGTAGLAIREMQDLVYRDAVHDAPGTATGSAERTDGRQPAEVRRVMRPDAVLLFRYSALTYNSHRIHYDWRYCTEVEGYAGLVVHGPLLATLLLDLFQRERPDAVVKTYRFRAQRALIEGDEVTLSAALTADGAELTARGPDGLVRMTASVTISTSA